MSIPPEFLEELRSRLPVSQVVGKHVQLRRAGRELTGLSPFNKEKTPSFTVNDQKQFYHCFSSGKHGDIISFVMEVEGLSFPEAVEALAAQAGMEVPKPTPQQAEQAERAKSLHDVCEAACQYFQKQLHAPVGRMAMDYVVGRGLSGKPVERFRLGYAPADRQDMRKALQAQGFSDALMIEAGLLKQSEQKGREPFAFFSHRLLFPVTDRRGRVVAFGGRLLEGEGPKYLNSPDTPLFHKSQLLYNMAGARQAGGKGHTIVIVEGYTDVIAMVMAGFEGAVAPLGTALTEEQIAESWRLAGHGGAYPILCFDGDGAGQRAAFRAVERVLPHIQPDHSVRFVTLPGGEDPDSLIRNQGRQALLNLLEHAQPLVDKLWLLEVSQRELNTPEAWAGLQAALDQRVETIQHGELRRIYGEEMRARVREATWQQRRSRSGRSGHATTTQRGGLQSLPARKSGRWVGKGQAVPGPLPTRAVARKHDSGQRLILKTLLNHPGMIEEYEAEFCDLVFDEPELARLRDAALSLWSVEHQLDRAALAAHLNARHGDTYRRLQSDPGLALVLFSEEKAATDVVRKGLDETIANLHRAALTRELAETARGITEGSGEEELQRLRSLYAEIDQERNQ